MELNCFAPGLLLQHNPSTLEKVTGPSVYAGGESQETRKAGGRTSASRGKARPGAAAGGKMRGGGAAAVAARAWLAQMRRKQRRRRRMPKV